MSSCVDDSGSVNIENFISMDEGIFLKWRKLGENSVVPKIRKVSNMANIGIFFYRLLSTAQRCLKEKSSSLYLTSDRLLTDSTSDFSLDYLI